MSHANSCVNDGFVLNLSLTNHNIVFPQNAKRLFLAGGGMLRGDFPNNLHEALQMPYVH